MFRKSKKIKIRPNQACPCGSGLKFKKCCSKEFDWASYLTESKTDTRFLSARGRNLSFKEILYELLQVDSEKQINTLLIRKAISPNFVRQLYEAIEKIWPPDTDLNWVYSRNKKTVAGLFIGDYELGYLEQAVVRHSLYADKILLTDPFLNPHVISSQYNPIVHPEHHLCQTLKNLNRFFALLPWVEAGIVDFIHTPAELDKTYSFEAMKRAFSEKRDAKTNEELQKSVVELNKRNRLSGGLIRTLIQLPDKMIENVFDEQFPEMTVEQKQELFEEVYYLRKTDSNFLDTLDKLPSGQYTIWTTGGTVENAHLTASMANAYIFTDLDYRWHKLQQERRNFNPQTSIWSPFSKAVQNAEFSFLDKVDVDVALKLRRDNRLAGVRQVMRKAWKSELYDDNFSNENAILLAENFNQEIAKAKEEWKEIRAELVKIGFAGTAIGMRSTDSAIAEGNGLWIAGASMVAGAGLAIFGSMKYRQYRSRFPASFFIGL